MTIWWMSLQILISYSIHPPNPTLSALFQASANTRNLSLSSPVSNDRTYLPVTIWDTAACNSPLPHQRPRNAVGWRPILIVQPSASLLISFLGHQISGHDATDQVTTLLCRVARESAILGEGGQRLQIRMRSQAGKGRSPAHHTTRRCRRNRRHPLSKEMFISKASRAMFI